jgi:hypothetical protein
MIIEGQVTGVMETWPLQLTVHTDAGTYQIILPEIVVTSGGQPVSPGDIRQGQTVRVEGETSGRRGIAAASIDIIGM